MCDVLWCRPYVVCDPPSASWLGGYSLENCFEFGKIELGATLSNAKLSHLVFGYGAHQWSQQTLPEVTECGEKVWMDMDS